MWAQRFQRVCNAESAQRWPRCLRAGWLRARGVAQFLHAEGSCARACGPRWSRVRCQTAGCTPVCLAQPDLPAVVFERSELLCGVCVCQTRMFLWPRHPFDGKWRLGWRCVARLRARVLTSRGARGGAAHWHGHDIRSVASGAQGGVAPRAWAARVLAGRGYRVFKEIA